MIDRIEWQDISNEIAPHWRDVPNQLPPITLPYSQFVGLSVEQKLLLAEEAINAPEAKWQIGQDPQTLMIFGRAVQIATGIGIVDPSELYTFQPSAIINAETVYASQEDLEEKGVPLDQQSLSFQTISAFSSFDPPIKFKGWEIGGTKYHGDMSAKMDYGSRQDFLYVKYDTQGFGLSSRLYIRGYNTETHIYEIAISATRLFDDSGTGDKAYDSSIEAGKGHLSFSKTKRIPYGSSGISLTQTWSIDQDGIIEVEYEGGEYVNYQKFPIRGVDAFSLANREMYVEALQSALQDIFGRDLPDVRRMVLDPQATFLALYKAIMNDPSDDLISCIVFKESDTERIDLLTSQQIDSVIREKVTESLAQAIYPSQSSRTKWSWLRSKLNPRNWR